MQIKLSQRQFAKASSSRDLKYSSASLLSLLILALITTAPQGSSATTTARFDAYHAYRVFDSRRSDDQIQPRSKARISPQVVAETADGQTTSVVILLAEQADLSAAYEISDQDARGWFVYQTLTEHAARTQVELKSLLNSRNIPYQSFWVANMLVASADRALVEVLTARADVARIDSNGPARWIEDPVTAKPVVSPSAANSVEWGVANVNAPGVWAQGFTGQGIVVADLDTGVRWTHNALKSKYRGWNGSTADHNYNWHDSIHSGGGSCGPNVSVPCDDEGHGTHTTGTMVGDDGSGNQIGVAPGAKWIGCRNMDEGAGTPATYTECFQFAIAPTDSSGNNANPAVRPHIVNNSWGCPAEEGCTTRAELETIVNNTEAAGIFVSVSAGNAGPGCSTVFDPPAIYGASFSVGAIDITNILANFSSRGPSTFYTPNLLKPNISAPGVAVRSCYRTSDSSYITQSGTSMASPHVVGVVALLWSAHPEISRNIAATRALLQNTANPNVTLNSPQTCGGVSSTQIPNNSFGYGRVDALAALNGFVAPGPTPTVKFNAASYSVNEGAQRVDVTVTRTGEALGAASVGFTTSDNAGAQNCNVFNSLASSRCDYSASSGTIQFAAGEISRTISVPIVNDSFAEGNESFTVMLTNVSGGVFDQQSATTVTIVDDDGVTASNPLSGSAFFVRQHYLDFLNREPDPAGLVFWINEISVCGVDAQCVEAKRISVSASYFLSIEFQQSGYLVERMYKAAYGDASGTSALGGAHQVTLPIVRFNEFLPDSQQIGEGVVVGQTGWEAVLEFNKQAFAAEFVQRPQFTVAFPTSMTPAQFVDRLSGNTGNVLSASERTTAIGAFGNTTNTSNIAARAQALRQVAEDQDLVNAEFNRAFVLMEYFGYLRRNPNDAPDADYTGYDFWLTKLNLFNGNYINAEMVKAFIASLEYRARFGP
jgi:serine protease AprX